MTLDDMMNHLSKGGQIFREAGRHRFFYKLHEGEMYCRCNELGGWHKSAPFIRGMMERYDWEIATLDYDYKMDKVVTTLLPEYSPEVQTAEDKP